MVFGLVVLVISGAIAAGHGYAKTAHRMRSIQPTRGRVVAREPAHTPRLGHVLVAGGIAGVVIGLLAILVATA